jgi:hypothetical protein
MSFRVTATLLGLGAVAYAAAPRTHAAAHTSANVVVSRSEAALGGDLVTRLDVAMGKPVGFALRVTNTGRKAEELRFPDGRTHDFIVLDHTGKTVWQWSAGRMFTQSLRTTTVDRGATVDFSEEWTPSVPKGEYTVVATLHSDNHPLEARQVITLR